MIAISSSRLMYPMTFPVAFGWAGLAFPNETRVCIAPQWLLRARRRVSLSELIVHLCDLHLACCGPHVRMSVSNEAGIAAMLAAAAAALLCSVAAANPLPTQRPIIGESRPAVRVRGVHMQGMFWKVTVTSEIQHVARTTFHLCLPTVC